MTIFRPLSSRVVLKVIAREETTKAGIVIPDNAREKPQEGVVVAVGPGGWTEHLMREPMTVMEGEKVLFNPYAGYKYEIDGVEHLIVQESDILGVIVE